MEKIEVGAGAGDNLVHAIALGAEMIRGLREVRSQIVIFTDGRAHSFGKRHPRDLRQIADLKQQLGDQLDIVMVDLARGGAENLAIVQSAIRGRVRRGRDTHVLTRVKNFGTNTAQARVELSLAGEKEPMGRQFTLLPGAEAVGTFACEDCHDIEPDFYRAGPHKLAFFKDGINAGCESCHGAAADSRRSSVDCRHRTPVDQVRH